MEFSLDALGQVIRELRDAKHLTQEALGREAHYGAGAAVSISRIESGLTRPGPEHFAGIAVALDRTPRELEAEAANRTRELLSRGGDSTGRAQPSGDKERIKDRGRRIEQEIEHREAVLTEFVNDFNKAHDRARDDFFMRFVEAAKQIEGAPQPDSEQLQDDDLTRDPKAEAEATIRLRAARYGVAHVLAVPGSAVAGAAVGGAAAYGTFIAAVSFGTASTGAAISGLSGAAATNAALALLGGGTLAAGGAGVAGGTMLLTGIVAAPAVLLGVGGLVWMVKRNRKQQKELAERLRQAEAEIDATRRGFDALVDILPRATKSLDYISIHASHALERWETQLGSPPWKWDSMNEAQQQRYQDFIDISASQLSLVSINVHGLMASRGEDREEQIKLANEVLKQSQKTVEALV